MRHDGLGLSPDRVRQQHLLGKFVLGRGDDPRRRPSPRGARARARAADARACDPPAPRPRCAPATCRREPAEACQILPVLSPKDGEGPFRRHESANRPFLSTTATLRPPPRTSPARLAGPVRGTATTGDSSPLKRSESRRATAYAAADSGDPSTPTTTLFGNPSLLLPFRATSTEQGALWMILVAVEPMTKPASLPSPCEPTTSSVSCSRSTSEMSAAAARPRTILPAGEAVATSLRARRSDAVAASRWRSSSM
jgi:hypothetical protein